MFLLGALAITSSGVESRCLFISELMREPATFSVPRLGVP